MRAMTWERHRCCPSDPRSATRRLPCGARLLIAHGADPNAQQSSTGDGLLHLMLEKCAHPALQDLLRGGGVIGRLDWHLVNSAGETPRSLSLAQLEFTSHDADAQRLLLARSRAAQPCCACLDASPLSNSLRCANSIHGTGIALIIVVPRKRDQQIISINALSN